MLPLGASAPVWVSTQRWPGKNSAVGGPDGGGMRSPEAQLNLNPGGGSPGQEAPGVGTTRGQRGILVIARRGILTAPGGSRRRNQASDTEPTGGPHAGVVSE